MPNSKLFLNGLFPPFLYEIEIDLSLILSSVLLELLLILLIINIDFINKWFFGPICQIRQ